jgi:transcriptional regulator with XRE-family HTH domain
MTRAPAPDPALGAALRRLRERRGLAQEQLAHDAGVSMGALSKVERGLTSPAWGTVRQLAGGLGVSLAELGRLVEAEE